MLYPFSLDLDEFIIESKPYHQSTQILEIQDKCFKGIPPNYYCEQNVTISVNSFDSPCNKENSKLICKNTNGIEKVTAICKSGWNYQPNGSFKCGNT